MATLGSWSVWTRALVISVAISLVAVPTLTYSFFFDDAAITDFYTLSLHDALPI